MNCRAVGIFVEGEETLIAVVDMASDADRSLVHKSLFTRFGSHVTQNRASKVKIT